MEWLDDRAPQPFRHTDSLFGTYSGGRSAGGCMRTIFQASPILRHANTQVPSVDPDVDWQVTLAVSSLREISQEGNVNGVQRLL